MAILQVYACIIDSIKMNGIMLGRRGMVFGEVRAEKQYRERELIVYPSAPG